MNKNKKITLISLLFIAIVCIAATVPLKNAFLQSDMNGNQFSMTNLNGLEAQTITVGTLTATNLNIFGTNGGLNITNLPLVTSMLPYYRIPFANTNNGSNEAIRYDNLLSGISGSLSNLANLPFANVLDFGAVGDGTTDNTLAFQQAIASGKTVLVPHNDLFGNTNGYMVGNLLLTNNGGLVSFNNAKMIFKPSCSNFMILMGLPTTNSGVVDTNSGFFVFPTNPPTANIRIEGLEFDGGLTTTPASVGNRHCLWFDMGGHGNLAHDLYIHGFSGQSFLAAKYFPTTGLNWPPFAQTDQAFAHYYSITCLTNGVGVRNTSDVDVNSTFQFNTPGNAYDGEYSHSFDLHCSWNYIGLWWGAGNTTFSDSIFSRNTINMFVDGKSFNNAHSTMSACILNHPGQNVGIIMTNVNNGLVLNGCQIWESAVSMTNCVGVMIENGQFSSIIGGADVVTMSGCTNCWLKNNAVPQGSRPTINLINSLSCGTEQNYYSDNGAIDTPYLTGWGAGGNLKTNGVSVSGSLIWPPTFSSSRASSTNQWFSGLSNNAALWFWSFDASSNVVYKSHLP